MTTNIYALIDPRTKEPRYVGKANDPPARLRRHLKTKRNRFLRQWIHELKEADLEPTLQILETLQLEQWPEREIFWISELRKRGHWLTNIHVGGNGLGSASEAQKKAISLALTGRKLAPAHVAASKLGKTTSAKWAAFRQMKKGKPLHPATIAAQRKAIDGVPLSKSHKSKLSAASKGKPKSPEHREAMIRAGRARRGVPQSDAHKAALSKVRLGVPRPKSAYAQARIKKYWERYHAFCSEGLDTKTARREARLCR